MSTFEGIQAALPTIALVVVYVYHLIFVHLPAKKQQALERLAPQAVQMVEQVSAGVPNAQKKALAISTVKMLLRPLGGALPSDEEINTFIEAAVFALKQTTAQSAAPTMVTPVLPVAPQYLGQVPPVAKDGGQQ